MGFLLAGCAASSHRVQASYVSPLQYQQYSCDELIAEMYRIRSRVNQISGRLDEAATNDAILTGIGIVIFWPTLLALGGTSNSESDLARLKGEFEAIQQVTYQKHCSFDSIKK